MKLKNIHAYIIPFQTFIIEKIYCSSGRRSRIGSRFLDNIYECIISVCYDYIPFHIAGFKTKSAYHTSS